MSAERGTRWKAVVLFLLALLLLHLSGIDLRENTLAREDASRDTVVVAPAAPSGAPEARKPGPPRR